MLGLSAQPTGLGPDGGNAAQYTARENDGTGLYYYRSRYYDPVLKRFISNDPIGLAGGINSWAYVGGNPVMYSDPRGLFASEWHREITSSSALASGMNGQAAAALAQLVVDVDDAPGSQGRESAHMHAMCTSGLSKSQCEWIYDWYIRSELDKCTMLGLANALHAIEDSFAGGHENFHPYSGMVDMIKSGEIIPHGRSDSFPSKSQVNAAKGAAGEVIREWQRKCNCK